MPGTGLLARQAAEGVEEWMRLVKPLWPLVAALGILTATPACAATPPGSTLVAPQGALAERTAMGRPEAPVVVEEWVDFL